MINLLAWISELQWLHRFIVAGGMGELTVYCWNCYWLVVGYSLWVVMYFAICGPTCLVRGWPAVIFLRMRVDELLMAGALERGVMLGQRGLRGKFFLG